MDEDYHRIERAMAEQNERVDNLIAAAEAVLRQSAAVTGKLEHVRCELEPGPCEPPKI